MTQPQFPHQAAASELLAALVTGLEQKAPSGTISPPLDVTVEQVTIDLAVGAVTSLVVSPDGTRYRVTVEPLEAAAPGPAPVTVAPAV